jgi:hypothetical protein
MTLIYIQDHENKNIFNVAHITAENNNNKGMFIFAGKKHNLRQRNAMFSL